jgi:flagellar hook-length control protein FliK
MQNMLDVASLSPPGMANATKPAANAVKDSKGEPFDLLLSKAAEKIEKVDTKKEEPTNRAESNNVGSDSRSYETERKSETSKTKEFKKLKTEDKEDTDENTKSAESSEPMIAVLSNPLAAEENPLDDLAVNLSDQQVTDLKIKGQTLVKSDQVVGLEDSSQEAQSTISDENIQKLNTENTISQSVKENNTTDNSKLINKPLMTENDLGKGEKSISPQSNPPSNEIKKESLEGNSPQDLNAMERRFSDQVTGSSLTGENQGANIKEYSNQKQNVTNVEKGSVVEELKSFEAKAGTASDSAPPGTNINPNSVIANNTQVTQLHEPARLAEAPKAETITQISNQIESLVTANRSSIRVQLYPEELGHIDLRIVSNKSGVGVTMVADKSTTQEILRSEMNMLKQSIEQAGIQLSDLNIGQGQNSSQNQMAEEQRGHKNFSYNSSEHKDQEAEGKSRNVLLQTSVVDYRV